MATDNKPTKQEALAIYWDILCDGTPVFVLTFGHEAYQPLMGTHVGIHPYLGDNALPLIDGTPEEKFLAISFIVNMLEAEIAEETGH